MIRTRSAPGFGSARSRSRRGVRWLAVLAWTAMLGGAMYFAVPAYLQRMQPPPLRDEPKQPTLAVPVTDVADAYARYRIVAFRDAARRALGEDEALFDTCSERTADEVRLAYGGGLGRASFVVLIKAIGDGARARWLPVDLDAPPPPPPPPGWAARGAHTPVPDQLPKTDPPEATRPLTATTWSALRAQVLAPAFLRLQTVNEPGADGFGMTIESCTGGHYHFVSRWSPRPPDDREFLRVADAIVVAGGSRQTYPRFEMVEAPGAGVDAR